MSKISSENQRLKIRVSFAGTRYIQDGQFLLVSEIRIAELLIIN
jgi:hypothetical protein